MGYFQKKHIKVANVQLVKIYINMYKKKKKASKRGNCISQLVDALTWFTKYDKQINNNDNKAFWLQLELNKSYLTL